MFICLFQDLRLRNENVLVEPKTTLIQPKTKREAVKTLGNKKSSNEARKGRIGKRFTREAEKPRAQEKNRIRNKKTKIGKKKTRGSNKKNNAERNGKKSGKITDKCFDSSMNGMKTWKDIVGNFQKQKNRMIKQIRTGESKNSKNGVFEVVYQKLVSAGGGDASNLSCAGSRSVSGISLT